GLDVWSRVSSHPPPGRLIQVGSWRVEIRRASNSSVGPSRRNLVVIVWALYRIVLNDDALSRLPHATRLPFMKRRMILMLTVVGLIIAALGFFKFRQISAAIAQGKSWTPPPEAVTTVVAKQEDWPATLNAIGSVVAVHGVT